MLGKRFPAYFLKIRFYIINQAHKQYSLLHTIFDYIFILGQYCWHCVRFLPIWWGVGLEHLMCKVPGPPTLGGVSLCCICKCKEPLLCTIVWYSTALIVRRIIYCNTKRLQCNPWYITLLIRIGFHKAFWTPPGGLIGSFLNPGPVPGDVHIPGLFVESWSLGWDMLVLTPLAADLAGFL